MLAVVCKTLEGVKTLERHDNEGNVNSGAGLHALGSFIGRKINGRFLVICLEDLRQEHIYLNPFNVKTVVRMLTLNCNQAIRWWVCC